ncbi:MAG TPA: GAF domain-containing protein [Trebonia sp.]
MDDASRKTASADEPGLLRDADAANGRITVNDRLMDVAAVKGFEPSPEFYKTFHLMLLRPGVVGVVIREDRSYLSTDVHADPHTVGQPLGHPPIRRFLGVPLRLGTPSSG